MNKTLLEYVNDILNDMDSDPVNSINDTIESEQVAQIVRSTYEAMMSNRNWPHLKGALKVESSGDLSYPTHMVVRDEVKEMLFINYNCTGVGETRKKYTKMAWKESDEFLRLLNHRNNDNSNVDVILDYSGIELLLRNDKHPEYYTSFDDKTLVFDSYDKEVDDTLQSSKIQAQAYIFPGWTHDDDAIPDIPYEAESLLLAEAKSSCMYRIKQMSDPKTDNEARRQNAWLARKAWKVKGGVRYQNYGRKGRK